MQAALVLVVSFVLLLVLILDRFRRVVSYIFSIGLLTIRVGQWALLQPPKYWLAVNPLMISCQYDIPQQLLSKLGFDLLYSSTLKIFTGFFRGKDIQLIIPSRMTLTLFASTTRLVWILFGWIRGSCNPSDVDTKLKSPFVETFALTAATGVITLALLQWNLHCVIVH